MQLTAGKMRERIVFETPATAPTRDVYGHKDDSDDNWDDNITVWSHCTVKGSEHTLLLRHTAGTAAITSGHRATREDGTVLHVLNAYDPDGTRAVIRVDAEPA